MKEGTIILNGLSTETLMDLFGQLISEKVEQAINKAKAQDLQERFLSPKETCKLFSPNISLVTLASWADKGLLKKYTISGRTYYKYAEVTQSLKSLKKYTHKN